ncbi:MAG: DUF4115 domain-containing protein [Bacillota bacterium]|nr:DUF4115 domain-containing protein [Bacillota bacterium]
MESVGSILRRRREEMGLSLEEVQARTKIRIRYLDAIERGDYELLPGEVYVRGFLRAYAEALELDPRPLLEQYRREVAALASPEEEGPAPQEPQPREAAPPAPPAPPRATLPPRARTAVPPRARARNHGRAAGPGRAGLGLRSPARFLGVLMAAVLLAGALGYVLWPRTRPVAPGGKPAATQTGGGQAAGKGGSKTGQPGGTATGGSQQGGAAEIRQTVSGQTVLYTLNGQGPLRLDVRFDDRVWLEVKADGKTVYSGTLPAGSERSWTAERELDIVTARPYAMTVSLNGQSLGTPSRSTQVTYLVFVVAANPGAGTGQGQSPGGSSGT